MASHSIEIQNSFSFCLEREKDDDPWSVVKVGEGGYANVYLVRETVRPAALPGAPGTVTRIGVAKIFKDDPPQDFEYVFSNEVDKLSALTSGNHIVSLRGAIEHMLPTLLCQEPTCAEHTAAFSVGHCPHEDCVGILDTDEHVRQRLICNTNREHFFDRGDENALRLLGAHRPCGHVQNVPKPINFLPRPCILLDRLDLNLDEFERLAVGEKVRGLELPFSGNRENPDWQRELFLMRLQCVIRVAEGLTEAHRNKFLHLDVSPANVMLRLPHPSFSKHTMIFDAETRLIDFGRSRERYKINMSTLEERGQLPHFLPPEQLSMSERITYAQWRAVDGGHWELRIRASDEARPEVGDIIIDKNKRRYHVVAPPKSSEGEPEAKRISSSRWRVVYLKEQSIVGKQSLDVRNKLDNDEDPSDYESGYATWIQAIHESADIYSLGCLVAWSITAGRVSLVKKIRQYADLSDKDASGELFEGAEWITKLEDQKSVLDHIALPQTTSDNKIRARLLDIVYRCLVRRKGCYCPRRNSLQTGAKSGDAASSVAAALAAARDELVLLHRGGVMADGDTADQLEALRNSLENERASRADAIRIAVEKKAREIASGFQLEDVPEYLQMRTELEEARGELASLREKLAFQGEHREEPEEGWNDERKIQYIDSRSAWLNTLLLIVCAAVSAALLYRIQLDGRWFLPWEN